ncbi:MAG: DUF4157 domain-containing protein [Haliscomenobacter sp.]|uniref:eCIS core domain-containing protein n=1 Tax=Haliscomenobacter sp. TaxID=2717303 RepID=UPI0029B04907|nr:DUF4157 domain-containing protein [Haliscomenobacter sp.]MDX2070795.1 DUF4157 domain-containing protein [Haliscomenobacter sp.]
MKAAESKSTTTTQQLQAKAETQEPFFQKERTDSVLEQGNTPFFSPQAQSQPFFSKPTIQTKLTVGQPGDQYEQEADQMADQVVQRLAEPDQSGPVGLTGNGQVGKTIQRKPIFESNAEPDIQAKFQSSTAQTTPLIQTKCDDCEQEEKLQKKEEPGVEEQVQMKPIFESNGEPLETPLQAKLEHTPFLQKQCAECAAEEETPGVQMQEDSTNSNTATPSLESRLSSSRGGGSPLPENTRTQMEGAFGSDFSGVRIHTDSSAVQMNKELGAQAFTHGSDVYFNAGKYDDGSREGKRLLGHELTHVVQQGGEVQPKFIQKQEADQQPEFSNNANVYIEEIESSENKRQSLLSDTLQLVLNTPNSLEQQKINGVPNLETKNQFPNLENEARPIDEKRSQSLPAFNDSMESQASENSSQQEGALNDTSDSLENHPYSSPTAIMDRLVQASESPIKPHAINQANLIYSDYLKNRVLIGENTENRNLITSNYFRGIKSDIGSFFGITGASFRKNILQFQRQVTVISTEQIAVLKSFLSSMLEQGMALGNQFSLLIHNTLTSTSDFLQSRILGVINNVTDLLNFMPLPDIPGVSQFRNFILSLINRGAEMLRTGLNTVINFITSALSLSIQTIQNLIGQFQWFLTQIFSNIFSLITRIIQSILQFFQNVTQKVLSTLDEFLCNIINPFLTRIESITLQQIEQSKQEALQALEKNTVEHLQKIANFLFPSFSKPKQSSMNRLTEDKKIEYIENIVQECMSINQEIISNFNSTLLVKFIELQNDFSQTITRLYTEVRNTISQIIGSVNKLISQIIDAIFNIVLQAFSMIQQILQQISNALSQIFQRIINLVQNPIDSLIELAENVWNRVKSTVQNLINNLLSGNFLAVGSTNSLFAPAFLAPAPVIVEVVIVIVEIIIITIGGITIIIIGGGTVIVVIGGLVFELPLVLFIIIVAIIVVLTLLIIALLIHLLYKYLTKPEPVPVPVPVPIPDPDDPDDPPTCQPDEIFDPTAPDGFSSPIGINWYKPLSVYDNPISLHGEDYFMTERKELPPPREDFTIGVNAEYLPFEGKILLLFNTHDRNISTKFIRLLRAAGYSWTTPQGTRTSPDHVQDLMWNGFDEFENLWPLESQYNEAAGRKQNSEQIIYFRPDPLRPCAVVLPITVARRRYNMSERRFIIISILRL